MAKQEHMDAAKHHTEAAGHHINAANKHDMNDHDDANQYSKKAHDSSTAGTWQVDRRAREVGSNEEVV